MNRGTLTVALKECIHFSKFHWNFFYMLVDHLKKLQFMRMRYKFQIFPEATEEDKVWNWDHVFTEIASELQAQWDANDPDNISEPIVA